MPEMDIKIKLKTDAQGAKDANDALKQVNKQAKETGDHYNNTASQLTKIRFALSGIHTIATQVNVASAAATGGLLLAAQNYVNQAKISTSISQQWLNSTNQIEKSLYRIGGVAASVLNPVMKTVAALAETTATYLEKNPAAVSAGVGILGTLAVGSGALSLLTTLGRGGLQIARAGLTAAATNGLVGTGSVAGGALGTTAGALGGPALAATAITGVIALGAGGLMAVGNAVAHQFGIKTSFDYASGAINSVGSWFQNNTNLGKTLTKGGVFGSTGAAAAGGQTDLATADDSVHRQLLTQYHQFAEQEQAAQRMHLITLSRAQRDFNIQQEYDQQDYDKQVYRAQRDLNLQLLYNEQDFNRQRYIANRDYQIQVARAEQDFSKDQKRAKEDHQWSLFQIIRSGDAMAYFEEMRSYNLQKSRSTEDYTIQRSRASQDFQLSQSDAEVQYQITRTRQLQQYAIQRSDAEIDFQIKRTRAAQQFAIQIDDLNVNYAEEKRQRQQAFINQIMPEIQDEYTMAASMRAQMNQTEWSDFQGFLDQASKAANLYTQGGRAGGGYSYGGGLYNLHPGEFVMSESTTQAAEEMARTNSLTQSTMMGMITNKQQGVVYNDHRSFGSRLTAEDRRDIKTDTLSMLSELMT